MNTIIQIEPRRYANAETAIRQAFEIVLQQAFEEMERQTLEEGGGRSFEAFAHISCENGQTFTLKLSAHPPTIPTTPSLN